MPGASPAPSAFLSPLLTSQQYSSEVFQDWLSFLHFHSYTGRGSCLSFPRLQPSCPPTGAAVSITDDPFLILDPNLPCVRLCDYYIPSGQLKKKKNSFVVETQKTDLV